MKTVIIVQARMSSTRLPGKVLKKVLGKPLLEYQIERLRRVKLADEIVIATTMRDADQPIINFCNDLSVPYFRGSENDVLARYYGAAKQYKASTVVRITSDCPVIDPMVIDKVISYYLDHLLEFDYVSNTLCRTYPRGMDTEVLPMEALSTAFKEAKLRSEREHVTPFIHRHPERFRLANIAYHKDLSQYRWTVDAPQDLKLIKLIIKTLYPQKPDFTLEDIVNLFFHHPQWMNINKNIEQKMVENKGK